jgi:hypothetical protein
MGRPIDGGDPFLSPAMKLFGIDPGAQVIWQLQLDTDGVAELESAKLEGNTLSWIYPTRCESNGNSLVSCRRVTRIHTRPGSKVIQWLIEYEKWDSDPLSLIPYQLRNKSVMVTSFALDMRRVEQD